MGIFSSLFGGNRSSSLIDPAEGHPLAASGLQAIELQDWTTLTDMYSSQMASDRFHWLQGLGTLLPLEFDLTDAPDEPAAQTILGAVWTSLAFRFRGAAIGSKVTYNAAERMWNALAIAEECLSVARETNAADTVTPALMLRCALGSDTYRGELRALKRASAFGDDPCLFGGFNYLTCQSEKWLGNRDQMWSGIRVVTEAAPNSAWLGLTARGHIEDWLWFMGFEDNPAAKDVYDNEMKSAQYRDGLEELDDAFWAGADADIQRSELQFAHNNFGWLLDRMQFKERAKRHVEAIGPYRTSTPWIYTIGDENTLKSWNKVRKSLGLPKLEG